MTEHTPENALAHLPGTKRQQLRALTELIRSMADIERIILYGSHARGDWVDDRQNGYLSDFDVLVLVLDESLEGNIDIWLDCEERARVIAGDTPVSIAVHWLDSIRERIAEGWPFYREVLSEGIVLYDAGRCELPTIAPLTPVQHYGMAENAFDWYLARGAQLWRNFEYNEASGWHELTAFTLHQMAETIYKTVLMVYTGYVPKCHDLAALSQMVAKSTMELGPLIPPTAPDSKRLATLIQSAYVDARYSFTYVITPADLTALAACVQAMRAKAERACRERLAAMRATLEARRA